MHYCLIRGATETASALNCGYVYGINAPSMAVGLVHALCVRAGLAQATGPVYLIHDFELRANQIFGERAPWMQRSAQRDVDRVAQLDVPRAAAEISLIFGIDAPSDGPPEAMRRIRRTLHGMRVGGGATVWSDPRIFLKFEEALAAAPAGFVVKHAALPPSGSPLTTLLDALSRRERGHGMLLPSCVGYRLLEDPLPRRGARGGVPHAFADPLVGVVRLEVKARATEKDYWTMRRDGRLIMFETASANQGE